MNIKNKLFFIILLILVTLIIIGSLSFWTLIKISEINEFIFTSNQFLSSMRRLNDSIKDLLIEYEYIDRAYSKWIKSIENYGDSVDKFFNSKTLKIFKKNEEIDLKINIIENLAKGSLIKIKNIITGYEKLLKEKEIKKLGFYLEFYANKNFNFSKITLDSVEISKFLSIAFDDNLTNLVDDLIKEGKNIQTRIKLLYFIILFIVAFSAVIYLLIFSNDLRNRIVYQEKTLSEIASGNLTMHLDVKGKDEISSVSMHINSLIDFFSSIINEIKRMSSESINNKEETSSATSKSSTAISQISGNISEIAKHMTILNKNITSTTNDVSKISESLSSLTKEINSQFTSVTESSSSIEEMVTTFNNISMVSKAKKDASLKLLEVTKEGGEVIQKTNDIVKKISENANDILETINIINEIATNINLLSMNASIEAAHAGEMGKGFSVVAEEVRKLAESTNENSRRIGDILTNIIDMTKDSSTISNQSNLSFKKITEEVNGFTNALAEISASMEELSLGSNEVLKTILNLSETAKIVKENSDQIEKNAYSINQVMKNTNDISFTIEKGMKEIESGTKEINNAMVYLNDLNKKSAQSLEMLNNAINRFKTA